MRPIPNDEFLAWAGARGIGPDERYPGPRGLVYVPYRSISRFWVVPESPDLWTHFAGSLLDGLEPWASCTLRFRSGIWPSTTNEDGWAGFFNGLRAPGDFAGAVRFDRGERAPILAAVSTQLAFA